MSDTHVHQTIMVYNQKAHALAVIANDRVPQKERDQFLSMLPKQCHILDAACGVGRDAKFFTEKNFRVTGIDLSEGMLEFAKREAPHAIFKKQDLRRLIFYPSTFDAIWACEALIHLKKDEVPGVLKSFYDILKFGGIAFFHIKLGQGEKYQIDMDSPDQSRYFNYFEQDEFAELVKDVGFTISNIYVYNEQTRFVGAQKCEWIVCFAQKNQK